MVWGVEFADPDFASGVSREAFNNGLVIETAGAQSQVLKFLPALTIEEALLREGIGVIEAPIGRLLSSNIYPRVRTGTRG